MGLHDYLANRVTIRRGFLVGRPLGVKSLAGSLSGREEVAITNIHRSPTHFFLRVRVTITLILTLSLRSFGEDRYI